MTYVATAISTRPPAKKARATIRSLGSRSSSLPTVRMPRSTPTPPAPIRFENDPTLLEPVAEHEQREHETLSHLVQRDRRDRAESPRRSRQQRDAVGELAGDAPELVAHRRLGHVVGEERARILGARATRRSIRPRRSRSPAGFRRGRRSTLRRTHRSAGRRCRRRSPSSWPSAGLRSGPSAGPPPAPSRGRSGSPRAPRGPRRRTAPAPSWARTAPATRPRLAATGRPRGSSCATSGR